MLIVIALITLLITIGFFKLADDDHYGPWDAAAMLSGVTFVISVFAMFWAGNNIRRCVYIIPAQIAMYEEENARIEEKVANTVTKYMEYESGVIMEIAPEDDAMSLISLYPDLKTDQLISEEINVYIANNNQIKELRAELVELPTYRWWLYFGH